MKYDFTELTKQLRQLNFAKTNDSKGYKIWFRYNNEPNDKCTHYAIVDTFEKFLCTWIVSFNEDYRTLSGFQLIKQWLIDNSKHIDLCYRITGKKDNVIINKKINDSICLNLCSATIGTKESLFDTILPSINTECRQNNHEFDKINILEIHDAEGIYLPDFHLGKETLLWAYNTFLSEEERNHKTIQQFVAEIEDVQSRQKEAIVLGTFKVTDISKDKQSNSTIYRLDSQSNLQDTCNKVLEVLKENTIDNPISFSGLTERLRRLNFSSQAINVYYGDDLFRITKRYEFDALWSSGVILEQMKQDKDLLAKVSNYLLNNSEQFNLVSRITGLSDPIRNLAMNDIYRVEIPRSTFIGQMSKSIVNKFIQGSLRNNDTFTNKNLLRFHNVKCYKLDMQDLNCRKFVYEYLVSDKVRESTTLKDFLKQEGAYDYQKEAILVPGNFRITSIKDEKDCRLYDLYDNE